MKLCNSCNKEKDESEFSFRNKRLNTFASKCKQCHSEYVKTHYSQNKIRYINRARISSDVYRDRNRQNMIKYLSDKKCIECGINDIRVLDFDHKHSKHLEISKMMGSYSWKSILKEIEKCDILCANCHRIKTSKQFNTYKNIT
jgi:hypothetical protein